MAAPKAPKPRALDDKNPVYTARLKVCERDQLSVGEFCERVGFSTATLRKLELGTSTPNSPIIPKLATTLGIPQSAISSWQQLPPLNEFMLQRAQAQMGRAHGSRSLNGAGGGSGNGAHGKVKGIFKKMEVGKRESLRTLTNTVNAHCIKSIRETTVPTQMLADFLREYYKAKGVEGTVVLDFVFEKLFD